MHIYAYTEGEEEMETKQGEGGQKKKRGRERGLLDRYQKTIYVTTVHPKRP